MFSPATRKSRVAAVRERNQRHGSPDSPSTPSVSVPNRPSTGTPAPWGPRLSVLARMPPSKSAENDFGIFDADHLQPVYVGEVPQIVRNAQANCLHKRVPGSAGISGGMDKDTALSWIICENQIFIWSYLSSSLSEKCTVVDFPSSVITGLTDTNNECNFEENWMVCIVKWKITHSVKDKRNPCDSAGVIMCHKKAQALVYWPDVFSESGCVPVVWLGTEGHTASTLFDGEVLLPAGNQEVVWPRNGHDIRDNLLNSIIAAPVPGSSTEVVVIACHSSGWLWQFYCSPVKIHWKVVSEITKHSCSSGLGSPQTEKVHAKSLIWRFQNIRVEESSRQFFLLIDHEVQCWSIVLSPNPNVTKLWSHEIVGVDEDLGLKKDLAGQKHIWLLDMQVDDRGKEFIILVATFCNDRVGSSSYTQYSLLTMQYKPGRNVSVEDYRAERVLEKKCPPQIIFPKGRVEVESVLLSMRLRIGGKPSGSAMILSVDGTATVTSYYRGSTRLYKFDLPYDAGKVLDASVLPSEESEGAWVVLTEKAGIWAIPEKAVLLGGIEPPERSLSRKGSLIGRTAEEGKRNRELGRTLSPKITTSVPQNDTDVNQFTILDTARGTAPGEEAEVLLGSFFHKFLLSGEVENVYEKLAKSGAFEKEGELNVFACMSKSIVDTLAKHWTTTRGMDVVGSAATVSQLLDKKHKHERFLQFLALSKCHEELSSKQGHSLLIILEHGEKLYAMIKLRDLHNLLSQNRSSESESEPSQPFQETAGSLWDLIQLVGERTRRKTVLLMDRDNAEVFYSKVSDLEEIFHCLSDHIQFIVGEDQHFMIQIRRTYEVSNACIIVIRAALRYRTEHRIWYPSPEGLVSWNCQPFVRLGLWTLASVTMQLLREASLVDLLVKSAVFSQLEDMTEILLEAYNSLVTARTERGEQRRGLVEEYHKRRDELLDSLYQQAQVLAEARYEETCKETEDVKLKEVTFREISLCLLSIAKRHEGYKTLWDICYYLHDTGLLRSLMHESVGPMGGFSYFVFKQLHEKKHHSKLLRLGEEFQDELATYLNQHKDLLWLHEVFLNHMSSASNTLHALALFVDEDSTSTIKEKSEPDCSMRDSSLANRRHLLNLAKIAAMAGKAAGFELKIRCIEADLRVLELQEEIVKQFPHEMEGKRKVLNPRELIQMCMNGKTRDLSLLAFDVITCTGSTFHVANKSLLEECWRNAVDQDDWLDIQQTSTSEGWSDEVCAQALKETVLFGASKRCYGPAARFFESNVDEKFPLRKADVEFSNMKESISCVEDVLMQHRDFPEAGKLMVTAVMMGKMDFASVETLDMELQ